MSAVIDLEWRRHWDRRFTGPSYPGISNFPGQFAEPLLNEDVEQWLRDHNMICEFKLEKVAHPSKRMLTIQAQLIFQRESDAMLFKLTWM